MSTLRLISSSLFEVCRFLDVGFSTVPITTFAGKKPPLIDTTDANVTHLSVARETPDSTDKTSLKAEPFYEDSERFGFPGYRG